MWAHLKVIRSIKKKYEKNLYWSLLYCDALLEDIKIVNIMIRYHSFKYFKTTWFT